MNTNTPSTTAPAPARWFTGPDRERIAQKAANASRQAGSYKNMPAAPEHEGDALRAGLNTASIQLGGLRADLGIAEDKARMATLRANEQYKQGLTKARDLLTAAATIRSDDNVGQFALDLADQIEAEIERAGSDVVPDPAPALPEVPGYGTVADRG